MDARVKGAFGFLVLGRVGHGGGWWGSRVLDGDLLGVVVVDGGRVVGGAQRLVGQRGPEESGELAGDRDVRDRRAFAVFGEVSVAVMQADLGLPGALVRLSAGGWRRGAWR